MRTSKSPLLSAFLAFVLACCLAACGGGQADDGSGGKIGGIGTPTAETPQMPAVRAEWGHVVFDNDDGGYILIDDEGELQQILQAFAGFDAFAEIGGRLERCYLADSNNTALFIFYFDNPGLANEEEILGVIEETRGNDIHTERVLDDGTKIMCPRCLQVIRRMSSSSRSSMAKASIWRPCS